MARSKWQIHLSTAMVLMIVASVLLFLNVQQRRHPPLAFKSGFGPWVDELTKMGWPWDAAVQYTPDVPQSGMMPAGWGINYCSLVADVFAAAALLATICVVLETIVAYRKDSWAGIAERRILKMKVVTAIVFVDALGAIVLANLNDHLRSEYLSDIFGYTFGWPLEFAAYGAFRSTEFSPGNLGIDIILVVCIVGGAVFISEFIIRRYATRVASSQ